MPHLTVPFGRDGPLVDLFVGVSHQRRSALVAANLQVPDFQIAKALIDTGASCTCIDPTILTPLAFSPTGTITIHTPSTAGAGYSCDQFDVALGIYHPTTSLIKTAFPVIATDLKSQGITALIGRDVLSVCLLVYDGIAGTLSLAF